MDFDSVLHQYQISYYKLPNSVKKFLGTLYGHVPLSIRFGKNYTIHKNVLNTFFDSDEQYKLDFQYVKTLETLRFAYDNIPYYKKTFDSYGVKVENFKAINDIKLFPELTKEIIQKNISDIYTDKFESVAEYYTGGSSSTPMKIYAPRSVSRSKEKIYILNAFSKIGYKYRDETVSLTARGHADEKNKKYWEYQKIDNYLLVSVNHLKFEFIEKIVDEISNFNSLYFYSFPSALIAFIKACNIKGIKKMEQVLGIMLVSESISHEHIVFVQSFFPNAEILSHYGHTERIISAYRLNKEYYNFYNSYGLTRVVENELVGTSFDNFVMPYINYKTKDYVRGKIKFFNNTDIAIGAEEIHGRLQEFVVTLDNTVIPVLSIGAGHFNSYDYVERAQFYQDTPGKVVLRIQTEYPKKINTHKIIEQMEEQVNQKIKFTIVFIDKIQNTHRRKNVLCVQNLDIEKYLKNT